MGGWTQSALGFLAGIAMGNWRRLAWIGVWGTVGCMPFPGPALADSQEAPIVLRGSLAEDGISLNRKIQKASQWGLRNSRKLNLKTSLVAEEPATAMDLGELRGFLSTAINRSHRLKSAIHEANAAHFSAQAEFSRLLPTVSLTGEIEREAQVNHRLGIHREVETRTGALTVNWTVFSSGANWAAYKAAKHQAITTDLRYLAGERQVFVENAAVYLDLAGAERLVRAIADTKTRLRRIRRIIAAQYTAGLTSRTDIAQIDSEIASVDAELEVAKSSRQQLRIAYRTLIGQAPPKRLKPPRFDHIVPKTKQAALERAMRSNHLISAAYSNERATRMRKRSILGQSLPQVSLFASGEVSEFSYDRAREDYDWSVGARITVPLFNAGTTSRYLEARERSIAASYQVEDIHLDVQREVESTWTAYQAAKRQKSALNRKGGSIKKALRGMRLEMEVGLRPLSDVLREEIKYAQNRVEIIRVDSALALNAYKLAAQFSDMDLAEIAP